MVVVVVVEQVKLPQHRSCSGGSRSNPVLLLLPATTLLRLCLSNQRRKAVGKPVIHSQPSHSHQPTKSATAEKNYRSSQAGQWDPLLFLPARGPAGPTKPTAAEQADTSISTPTHPGTRIRSVQTIPSQPIVSTPPRQGKAVAASQPPLPSPRRGNPSQATRQSCWPYAAANHRHSDPLHPACSCCPSQVHRNQAQPPIESSNRSSSEPIEGESSDSTSTHTAKSPDSCYQKLLSRITAPIPTQSHQTTPPSQPLPAKNQCPTPTSTSTSTSTSGSTFQCDGIGSEERRGHATHTATREGRLC